MNAITRSFRSIARTAPRRFRQLVRKSHHDSTIQKNIWIEEANGLQEAADMDFKMSMKALLTGVIICGVLPGMMYRHLKKTQVVSTAVLCAMN